MEIILQYRAKRYLHQVVTNDSQDLRQVCLVRLAKPRRHRFLHLAFCLYSAVNYQKRPQTTIKFLLFFVFIIK